VSTALLDSPQPGVHSYTPRGAALEVMHSRAPEVLLSGPAGTGKSRACLEKLHAMMLANPGARGLIVRKVRDTLSSTGLVTWREHVAAEALAMGVVTFYGGSASEPPQYRYANGSRIMIGGMDKPTKVMSSEYDVIYVQEAIELVVTDWENLTTRLRNGKISFQQLIADTNPDTPVHWLYQRTRTGATQMLHSRHEDNPTLFDAGLPTPRGAAYLAKLDALTGVRHERLRHGRWVAAEGLVYEDYDPQTHHRVIADPPHDWTRYWAVDFGYTNPFVLQCWAIDPDGRAYLYRELYRSKRLVEDHARDILAIVRRADGTWREPQPHAIICDHDAEDRATLERHLEMPTIPAEKTVSDGIQAVQARFRVQPDGRPRIYLNPAALVSRDPELDERSLPVSTVDELPGYVWDVAREGTVAAERSPKEEPLKRNDHGCDALRYLCAYLDLAPKPRMRGWL
jgi:PBSX family phage terminase large subunit